ncbi:MAG: zinc ribbon domain-containing protein [Lachnospiraceae bacterium]|nr:zinc ribbon domain-containing protein [Lachnospiraceae bacterium]
MFCTTCGRELPDGSKFCSGCGLPINNVEIEDTFNNPVEDYSQNNMYNQNGYTYQQTANEYIAYKKKVAPFKVIAAIINLLTTFTLGFMALAYIGVGSGVEGMDVVEKVDPNVSTGFMICGFVLLIFSFFMLIASIVAIIVPAKAGVICNLIFTISCGILLIWSIVLNFKLGGVADKLNSYGISMDSTQLVSDMVVGLYVFIFLNAGGQFISFILSIIGMMFKKKK